MTIELGKTYRTHAGREVRLYAITDHKKYPVHGAVLSDDGWSVQSWSLVGEFSSAASHMHDLVEVKPRHKRIRWINHYAEDKMVFYSTRKEADYFSTNRIACVRVDLDFQEGEGL